MLAILLVAQGQVASGLVGYLEIINAGGTITVLVVGAWAFATQRIVPGSAFDRVIAERNAKDEQIAALHKEAAITAQSIQEKVIPALVETTLIMREVRRGGS